MIAALALLIATLTGITEANSEWMSLTNGVEVKVADASHIQNPGRVRRLRDAQQRFLSSNSAGQYFADSAGTYYDEYAQFWRLLGFYVDCNVAEDNRRRRLEDGSSPCERYLLWAAYVDLDYQGGGLGEYKMYDRFNDKWDDTSCQMHGDGRCVKMDCHLPDTSFELLGFFKEPNFNEWMEQLFKHEGVCVWTDDEYQFMKDAREDWPDGCTNTGMQDEKGNYLYYDVKPVANGMMDVGLFTDSRCSASYGGEMSTYDVLKQVYGGNNRRTKDGSNTLTLEQFIETWNEAFSVFTICQPCKAYTPAFLYSANEYNGGNQDNDDANGGYFSCDDDGRYFFFECYLHVLFCLHTEFSLAGYNNVNQCMKFRTKTEMLQASMEDVAMASSQGSITEVKVGNAVYGKAASLNSLGGSISISDMFCAFIFIGGMCYMIYSYVTNSHINESFKEPLVASDGVAA